MWWSGTQLYQLFSLKCPIYPEKIALKSFRSFLSRNIADRHGNEWMHDISTNLDN